MRHKPVGKWPEQVVLPQHIAGGVVKVADDQPDKGRGVGGVDDIVVVLRQELFQGFIGNQVVLAEGGAGEGDVVGEASQRGRLFRQRICHVAGQLHRISRLLKHFDMRREKAHGDRHSCHIENPHRLSSTVLFLYFGRNADISSRI